MVTRIFYSVLCLAIIMAFTNPGISEAAYCGPNGCAPVNFRAPAPGPMPMPMPVPGPAMGPAPMGCLPNCPPPCPPPACGPTMGSGFNPLSAIFSVIAFPFKLIGGAFSNRQECAPMMCPPPGCMPMCMPNCGPQPITKCKAPKRAAFAPGPMGY
jgi:hypothetical protein